MSYLMNCVEFARLVGEGQIKLTVAEFEAAQRMSPEDHERFVRDKLDAYNDAVDAALAAHDCMLDEMAAATFDEDFDHEPADLRGEGPRFSGHAFDDCPF